MKTIILLLILLALSGCASMLPSHIYGQWVGHNISEAVDAYGAPDRTFVSANGTTLYTWQNVHVVYGNQVPCAFTFSTDADGTIQKYSYNYSTIACY